MCSPTTRCKQHSSTSTTGRNGSPWTTQPSPPSATLNSPPSRYVRLNHPHARVAGTIPRGSVRDARARRGTLLLLQRQGNSRVVENVRVS